MVPDKTAEAKVSEAVAQVFKKNLTDIKPDIRFVEDLMAKSVNFIEITAILEYQFGVTIPLAQARRAKTVGELTELINAKYS